MHPGGPALPSLPPPPRRALSAWPLLLVASVAALPAHARAQDDDELEIPTEAKANDQNPPVVKRFVPGIVMPGKVTLRVRIADDSPLLVATLYWRPNAGRSWQAIPLESQSRGLYSAQIDVEGDFQYWVEAFDVLGNGPGLDGAADRPYDVEVQRPRASEPLPVENPPARDETPPTLGEKPPAPELPLSSPPPPPRPPPSPKPLPPAEPPPPPILLSRVARVSTAQPATAGRLQFSLDGSYFNGTDFLVPGTTLLGGAGAVRLAWAPHALVELSASTSGRGAVLGTERPRRSTLLTAIGDSALGLRGVLPSVPALGPLRLAAEVNVELHTPFQGDARGVAASTTALLAATVEQGGLRTHLQAGYRWDNTENLLGGTWSDFPTFALGLSRFDALGFGVAVEAPLGIFVPFAEYVIELPVERRFFGTCDQTPCAAQALFPAKTWQIPQRAGVGARLELGGRVALVGAAEFSFTPAGSDLSNLDYAARPAREGLAPPPPFAARLALVWQLGDLPAPPPSPAAAAPPASVVEPAATLEPGADATADADASTRTSGTSSVESPPAEVPAAAPSAASPSAPSAGAPSADALSADAPSAESATVGPATVGSATVGSATESPTVVPSPVVPPPAAPAVAKPPANAAPKIRSSKPERSP